MELLILVLILAFGHQCIAFPVGPNDELLASRPILPSKCIRCISKESTGTFAFDKQGHRGARGLMPENTIPAMLKALDLEVTTLEMDTVITKDGKVILSHEPFFNSEITTKPDGSFIFEGNQETYNIFNMTFAETQQYDVGLKPHARFPRQKKMPAAKPLLIAVIDAAEAYAISKHRALPLYNIETKSDKATDGTFHPVPSVFVDTLIAVISDKGITDRVTIQSFDWRTLRYLHENYPSIQTAMLIEADKRSVQAHVDQLGFVPTIYSPEFGMATQATVNEAHALGMKYIPWTVNTLDSMVELINMGVDGVITDYPNLFESAFAVKNPLPAKNI